MILINNENQNHFLRMCRALALRRIKGSHTSDCVAGMICTIHEDLDVSKVVSTVTDNTSNVKKVFECYTTCKDSDEEEDDDDIEEPVSDINKERTDNSNTITTCTTCFSHLEFGGNCRH